MMEKHLRSKQELSEAIRRRIRAAGLSLAEMDRRLGWSTGYLSQVLNGHNSFRVEHLFQIAEVLEVAPREIFEELDPPAEADGEMLPGGVSMAAFMDLLERQVDRAVDARLEEMEKREEAEAKRNADEDGEDGEAD